MSGRILPITRHNAINDVISISLGNWYVIKLSVMSHILVNRLHVMLKLFMHLLCKLTALNINESDL